MLNPTDAGKKVGLIALGCGLGCSLPFLLPFIVVIFLILFQPSVLKNSFQQLEAEKTVSRINESQEDYFSKNNRFASQIEELKLDIKSETDSYSYGINVSDSKKSVKITAKAKNSDLLSFTGAVFAIKVEGYIKPITLTQICQSKEASLTAPEMPQIVGIKIQCPPDSTSTSSSISF